MKDRSTDFVMCIIIGAALVILIEIIKNIIK